MSRTVMQQALEALECLYNDTEIMVTLNQHRVMKGAITALRAALAEPEQEPQHDYRTRYDRGCYKCGSHYCPADCPEPTHLVPRRPEQEPQTTHWEGCEAVHPECRKQEQEPDGISWLKRDSGYFTAPTPRKPLTPEQLTKIELGLRVYADNDRYDLSLHDFARAVEAAHGIGEQHE